MIELNNVYYRYKGMDEYVIKDLSVSFDTGTLYAVYGDSGVGKTTLLSLIGGLDAPECGSLRIDKKDYYDIGLQKIRQNYISFVFQSYNLIPYLSSVENIELAMDIRGVKNDARDHYIMDTLASLGLSEKEMHRPVKRLSGGQQQRVCIARALTCNTPYILADEPTGNLDKKRTMEIADLFVNLAHKHGKCVIVVTHSIPITKLADQSFELYDGKLHANTSSI